MDRIKLGDAVIAANGQGAEAVVLVFRHGATEIDNYEFTAGACHAVWREDPSARFPMLFEVTMILLRVHSIPVDQIARALRVIPECEGLLAD